MVLNAVADGTKGGVVQMGMEDEVSAAHGGQLSASVRAQVDAAKTDVLNGKIKLYKTYKEALAAGAVPAGLAALDD